jgi:hypothetical protein
MTIVLQPMPKSFVAPRRIGRIAARRIFTLPNGRPVTLTIGVPQRVPGSDWGCAVQITGLNSGWRRPRYVFGIDGLQALDLAMQCAGAELESASLDLAWLGDREFPLMPKFFPLLPRRQQDRLQTRVEREAVTFWARFERLAKAKAAKKRSR